MQVLSLAGVAGMLLQELTVISKKVPSECCSRGISMG
jgi:hypothetical protein